MHSGTERAMRSSCYLENWAKRLIKHVGMMGVRLCTWPAVENGVRRVGMRQSGWFGGAHQEISRDPR
jgi:hypothetical protein